MAITMAVATPATAKAPTGPWPTISSTRLSSAVGWSVFEIFAMEASSFGQQLAQFVGLRGSDRRARVIPGNPDIGDNGCDLVVIEDVAERWHAVRPRILLGSRRVAAVEHHAYGVDGRRHGDGLVTREGREGRRGAF